MRHQDHRQRELALKAAEDVQHLALDDDVERGDRLVGDDEAGRQRQRQRDRGALAHAAGELMRVIGEPPRMQADGLKQHRGPASRRGTRLAAADDEHLLELTPDRVDRIERVHGALRHKGNVAPADALALGVGEGRKIRPLKAMRPCAIRAFEGITPMIARAKVVLPQPDFADEADEPRPAPRSSRRRRRAALRAGSGTRRRAHRR